MTLLPFLEFYLSSCPFQSGKVNQSEGELGIAQGLLSKWKRQLNSNGAKAFPGSGRLPEDEEEIGRLKRELERVTAERDLLKKC